MRAAEVLGSGVDPSSASTPAADGRMMRPKPFHSAMRSQKPAAMRALTVSVLHDVVAMYRRQGRNDCLQCCFTW